MAEPPSFVPRDLLSIPADFGQHEDVTWRLAATFREAVVLARAREQHELAYRVHRLLRKFDNSTADLADALGLRRESLWAKLRGHRPAQEEDLIVWSWITGADRCSYTLAAMVATPQCASLPDFPLPRRRSRRQDREER